MTITTILFDVGGVIFAPLDPEAVAARRRRLAHGLGYANELEMWHRFYGGPEWQDTKTGRMTYAQMWHILLVSHGLATPAQQEQFVAELFTGEGVDPEMRALIQSLHGRYQLGILSNAADNLEDLLRQLALFPYFDQIINSHRIGVAKPEREAYEIALARLAVLPQQVYFIDDQARNTAVAEEMGITSHVFIDTTSLKADLKRRALL